MKQNRLFQIIYILLEKKIMTAPELAEKLEVSVRTIYRDVDTLSASGIPIYALSGKNGGISLMSGYSLDNSILTDKEQNEVLFALQSLQATGQSVDLLLTKLGSVFKKESLNWIEVDFSRWGHKIVDSAKFNLLRQSILNKQIIHIFYLNSSGNQRDRSIKPIKLIFKQTNWYLQAFCLNAQDFRTFKINRIASLSLSNEYFDDIFESIPPIDKEDFSPQNNINLKLMLSANMAFRVYDEFSPDDVVKTDNGNFIVTVSFPIDSWVYHYIFSFGEDIEILEPKWLKEELLVYIEKLQKHFKS